MAVKRTSGHKSSIDQGSAISAGFNQYAGAHKHLPAGPALNILGTLASPVTVPYGASLWIYNNSGTVGWINFYAPGDTPVSPTSLANAIAVPANSYLQVNSGIKNTVQGSAATLGVYQVVDDSVLNPNDNQGT